MNYLRKNKEDSRKKNITLSAVFFFVVIIVGLNFFKPSLFGSFANTLGRPFFKLKTFAFDQTSKVVIYIHSKESIARENIVLKTELDTLRAELLQFNQLTEENTALKAELGRVPFSKKVLAYVLAGPGFSPYDTLLLDAGSNQKVKAGDTVDLEGGISIGLLTEVYSNTSKARLFSSPGEKITVLLPSHSIIVEALGRGGGNFEIKLPKGIEIQKGALITMPGIEQGVVGIVETILSDAPHSFQTVIFRSPFNVHEINKVYISQR